MFKKIFILIFFLFVFSLFKNSHIVSAEVLMECPGLKNYKNWCAGEYKGNEAKSCLMIYTPIILYNFLKVNPLILIIFSLIIYLTILFFCSKKKIQGHN